MEDWGKKKLILEWDEDGFPIGPLGDKLTSHLNTYARNGRWFPLTYKEWSSIEDKDIYIEQIWKEILEFTNAPGKFYYIFVTKLREAWKRLKYRIKKNHYDKYPTDKERLEHKPDELTTEDWEVLVKYWGLDSTQQQALQNKKNREKQVAHPRNGRKTIANIRHERAKKNLPVDDISMWLTLRGPNGVFNEDDGAADIEATLTKRLEELPEAERNDESIRNQIFAEVVGEGGHGRALLRGVGARPQPKRPRLLIGPSSSEEQEENIKRLEAKIEEKERMHKEEMEVVKNELETTKGHVWMKATQLEFED